MRRLRFATGVVCLFVPLVSFAKNLSIVPTTTLAAQTSNNTSTASSFKTQTNGNPGPANVSKLDVHSLLYAGASTKVYAHMMLWFGQSNHMNVGYSSTDAAQIKRQIEDMISRGIEGVFIDWYGPNNSIDQATALVMNEAEAHPGFTFAITVDQGAIQWDSCSGCTPQQALTQQMQYVEQKYFPSPAYLRFGGVPVVGTFGIVPTYTIDWNALTGSLATAPDFLFQNNGGFTQVRTAGSQAWVMPTTTDYGMSYLSSFYGTGAGYPKETTVGGAYKGFNDTLAAWGSNRVMSQQCGQTWLQTFSKISSLYNSSKQLPVLQLVTWNDYEEGTEIESGIDNCVSISASVSGGALQWKISGKENTIDHYSTYISSDGQHLMPLQEMATGLRSLNLCSYSLSKANYTLYVQAVGKPGLLNHMSGAVRYTPNCGSSSGSAVKMSVAPSSVAVSQTQSGSTVVTLAPQSGSFNNAVALSCSNLPQTLTCSFVPAMVTPGSAGSSSTLTISAGATSASRQRSSGSAPLYASFLLAFGMVSWAGASRVQRRRVFQILLVAGVAGLTLWLASCGGGPGGQNAPSATASHGTYSISIEGSSGDVQVSAPATVLFH